MTNHQTGHDAEKVAADYLKEIGYKIHELNWKTKYCEIDIVAQKDNVIYFVEVKYRKSVNFGDGFDQVTPKKLKQMAFAAEMWVASQGWGGDYQLAVIAMDGSSIRMEEIN